MNEEYKAISHILQEIDYLREAKRYVSKFKNIDKRVKIDEIKEDTIIGKKFNMLTVIEKTDRKSKWRKCFI